MFSRDLSYKKSTFSVDFVVGDGEGDEGVGGEDVAVFGLQLGLGDVFLE